MPNSLSNTAILFFSRNVEEEILFKDFGLNQRSKQKYALAKSLIKHSLQIAKNTGLPVCTIYSNKQKGGTFGHRLSEAFQAVFSKGYDHVIAIPNDCPNLTEETILDAATKLQHNKIVIGPTQNGGLYLLGLQRDIISQLDMINMPWNSSMLISSWNSFTTINSLSTTTLPSLQDINTVEDIYCIDQTVLVLRQLFYYLHSLLFNKVQHHTSQLSICSYQSKIHFVNRGPPLF